MGREPPGRIGNVPEIEPSYLLWWTAWQDLKTERAPGGLYPIPITTVRKYAEDNDLDYTMLKDVVYGLDGFFTNYLEKKQAAKKGTSNG